MTELGLTESLARFVAQPLRLPSDQTVQIIKRGFTDSVATMLGGRGEPVVRIISKYVQARRSEVREASILLGSQRAASADAALVNGTSAHVLDYDDVALRGHPSTVLMPAVLAEGEHLDVSGADAIRAYLVGYEIWAELVSRECDPYHEKGWHPTSVLGTVAAAAAVCHLHQASVEQSRNALALAASMASGLVANFGTMTKPFHAGRAAACGIEATRLAIAGLTAAPDAIEHNAGYLAALSPRGRADRSGEAANLGKSLQIQHAGLSIKKYPTCYGAHRAIDGVLDLMAAHDFAVSRVQEVRVTIGTTQATMLRSHAPTTALEAKFSLEFAVASALIARSVGLRELTDAFVNDPNVQQIMRRVRILTVDSQSPLEPALSFADSVAIQLDSGQVLDTGDIRFARGDAQLPLQEKELEAKFFDCASAASYANARELYELLQRLETLDSLRRLRA